MQEYKLTPVFLSQVQTRLLIFFGPLIVLGGLAGILVGGRGNLSFSGLLIGLLLIGLVVGVGIYIGLRQQRKLWSNYRLLVDDNAIQRVQPGLPDLTLARTELTKITESEGQGLIVYGSAPNRQLIIPAALERYSEVRARLAGWHSIETVSRRRVAWLSLQALLWGGLAVAAFVTTMLATNPIVSAVTGLLLLAGLIASLAQIQRSPHIPRSAKLGSWLMVFPMFALAARIVLSLTSR